MEEKQKTAGELRREALLYQPKNGYDRLSAQTTRSFWTQARRSGSA